MSKRAEDYRRQFHITPDMAKGPPSSPGAAARPDAQPLAGLDNGSGPVARATRLR